MMSRVMLLIRHPCSKYVLRTKDEWAIRRTEWTKLYLDSSARTLSPRIPHKESAAEYETMRSDLTSLSCLLREAIEITGSVSSKLFISSSTVYADIFLVLRAFTPEMKEVNIFDFLDPHTAIDIGGFVLRTED